LQKKKKSECIEGLFYNMLDKKGLDLMVVNGLVNCNDRGYFCSSLSVFLE
jgi:hypothetical protein